MKAMVLAAGLGTRLRPLTDSTPKALVPVAGKPLLARALERLKAAGVEEVIVNVHHHAGQVERFLEVNAGFGLGRVELSREETLLETGGGLKKAAWFFDDGRPFFLYNADIVTDISLPALYRFHLEHPALATLAVQARPSSRLLLFAAGQLVGRREGGRDEWAGAAREPAAALGFAGLHVLSPEIFPLMTETGVFSITKTYLRLAAAGRRVQAFRCDDAFWADVGSPEKLRRADAEARARGL